MSRVRQLTPFPTCHQMLLFTGLLWPRYVHNGGYSSDFLRFRQSWLKKKKKKKKSPPAPQLLQPCVYVGWISFCCNLWERNGVIRMKSLPNYVLRTSNLTAVCGWRKNSIFWPTLTICCFRLLDQKNAVPKVWISVLKENNFSCRFQKVLRSQSQSCCYTPHWSNHTTRQRFTILWQCDLIDSNTLLWEALSPLHSNQAHSSAADQRFRVSDITGMSACSVADVGGVMSGLDGHKRNSTEKKDKFKLLRYPLMFMYDDWQESGF